MSGLLVGRGTLRDPGRLPIACISGLRAARSILSPAAINLNVKIARRQRYPEVSSPAANSLCVRIARFHGYPRVLGPAVSSMYVRIARRQGYLRIPSPDANNLYVRIARRQGYLRVRAHLPITRMSEMIVARGS